MMLHQHIRDLAPGGLLKVIATDPSTRRDIPKFCVFLDHELVGQHEEAGTYLYWIRKKSRLISHHENGTAGRELAREKTEGAVGHLVLRVTVHDLREQARSYNFR
jgi:tRNA 2-thiouridine synthesizing protein A